MMEASQVRSFRSRIRLLEEEARRLVREIFAVHEGDVRQEERLVLSKADIFFAALEDALHIDPTVADPHKNRIRRLQQNAEEFFLKFAEIERERRAAYREEEELDLEKKRLQAKHVREEADASAELIDRLRPDS
jgi:hypothetical protein